MLLPESDPKATHIMVATGTGIAPYRTYLRRMFMEDTPFKFSGLAWLFLGVANTDSLLYDDEWKEYLKLFPDNFRCACVMTLILYPAFSGVRDESLTDDAMSLTCTQVRRCSEPRAKEQEWRENVHPGQAGGVR